MKDIVYCPLRQGACWGSECAISVMKHNPDPNAPAKWVCGLSNSIEVEKGYPKIVERED